jgi:hypothetical protein
MAKKRDKTVFSPGKARWLVENVEQLDESERALLLALAQLDQDTGRKLTDEERAALDKLAAETHDFSASEIQGAIHKMVEGQPQRKAGDEWPSDLKRKFKHARKKKTPRVSETPGV